MKNHEFKIGEKVYHPIYGAGIIEGVRGVTLYPFRVRFEGFGNGWTFTEDGKLFSEDSAPSIFPYPVKVVPENPAIVDHSEKIMTPGGPSAVGSKKISELSHELKKDIFDRQQKITQDSLMDAIVKAGKILDVFTALKQFIDLQESNESNLNLMNNRIAQIENYLQL